MRTGRIITLILLAGSLALAAFGIVLYLRADRKAPQIIFTNADLRYSSSMSDEELLVGVTAQDDRDGDITERVVVEKVVYSDGEGKVVVYYAASDAAGNVAKSSRQFDAEREQEGPGSQRHVAGVFIEDITETTIGEAADDRVEDTQEIPGEAEGEDESDEAQQAAEEAARLAAEEEERRAEEEAQREAAEREAAEREAEQQRAREEERERARAEEEAERQRAEDAAQKAEEDAEKPHITLKKNSVTVPVGYAPAWVDIIGSLTDNKDGYEKLFQNLSVSKFDKNKAGTYNVTITTTDSDKNVSDPVPLTIIVK
ncbi:MAG: hypothetical protein K6B72_02845 [Lachnospiraceae bacterium]|nr:hypothetical protein [Lachnospiraceae bacterium]